jgi:hypothetical protein
MVAVGTAADCMSHATHFFTSQCLGFWDGSRSMIACQSSLCLGLLVSGFQPESFSWKVKPDGTQPVWIWRAASSLTRSSLSL